MKKFLVCFKTVPDLDMLSDSDWSLDETGTVDTRYVKKMINPYDECALELVLKLRDELKTKDEDVEITAFTLDNNLSGRTMKSFYALGFKIVAVAEAPKESNFDSMSVTEIIKDYVASEGPFDGVFLGVQSSPGDNGKTPFLLSEKLGIPCVQGIKNIHEKSGKLHIESLTDSILIKQELTGPVVFAIGNVASAYLRIPTLKDRLAVKNKKPIDFKSPVFDMDDNGTRKGSVRLLSLKNRDRSRNCEMITGHSPKEIAEKLYSDYLKDRVE